MSESIFQPATTGTEDPATQVANQNPTPNQTTLPPEVVEFVGEGKKYKTTEDALKSIPHAQNHISRLEQELIEAKAQAAKAIAAEELLEEIRKQGMTKATEIPAVTPASASPQVAPVDIDKRVEQVLAKREMLNRQEVNRQSVINAFEANYGKEGEAYYLKLAEENGMPLAELNRLAVTSPEVVLKLAGLKRTPAVGKTTATINTSGDLGTKHDDLSSKVNMVGATTKDVTQAWRNAGVKVQQRLKT